jgi:alkylation response protein AidB-like acyl-CoA dehydrogenase
MDFSLTKEEQAFKQELEEFFEEEMKNAPPGFGGNFEDIYDAEGGNDFHRYMAKRLGEKGWIAHAWPKKYGGMEATIMEQMIFDEVRGKYGAPGIDAFGVGMFAPTLLVGATEEQKERLLPPIAKGEVFYCQGWSEPDAGSDLASLTTLAIRDGDHYIINGQKTWTTGGHCADKMFLLARTDPDSKRGKGLSIFNVDMNLPGVELRPLLYMDGGHVYNEVYFKDVKISADDLVGEEGKGWELTRQTMNFERSGTGGYAGTRNTINKMITYMKETKRGGKTLADDPINRKKIAELIIDSELGSALGSKIGWYQSKNDQMNIIWSASSSKLWGTELSQKLSQYATEIMGAYGQLESGAEAPLGGSMPGLYQFCKGMTIFAGSNEIQRNLIAWVGLGLPRLKFKP